jgi:glycosyltransferase involved in cell wall biosynthesis
MKGGKSLARVSIIIPTYNSEMTIKKTVISCLNQTFNNIEIIIIDDGSTDQTRSHIYSFHDDRLRYYYFENSGRSVARNRGLELAKGKYIQFLDSDDTLDLEKIEKAIEILEADSTIDAVQCGTTYWREGKKVFESKAIFKPNKEKLLLRENIFPIHSVVLKKEIVSIFPEGVSYCEDWYFWAKTLRESKIYFQDEYPGANVFIHNTNTMANHREMLLGELYILLRLKQEIKCNSILRDIKILKQYIYYSSSFDVMGLQRLNHLINYPLLKFLILFINNPFVRRLLKKITIFKNKMYKKNQLYD